MQPHSKLERRPVECFYDPRVQEKPADTPHTRWVSLETETNEPPDGLLRLTDPEVDCWLGRMAVAAVAHWQRAMLAAMLD